MCIVGSACDGTEPLGYKLMVEAGRHRVVYSPLPALLQRQFSAEEHVPKGCLVWSITASVLILSVSSWHWCLGRKERVSGTDMVIGALVVQRRTAAFTKQSRYAASASISILLSTSTPGPFTALSSRVSNVMRGI